MTKKISKADENCKLSFPPFLSFPFSFLVDERTNRIIDFVLVPRLWRRKSWANRALTNLIRGVVCLCACLRRLMKQPMQEKNACRTCDYVIHVKKSRVTLFPIIITDSFPFLSLFSCVGALLFHASLSRVSSMLIMIVLFSVLFIIL